VKTPLIALAGLSIAVSSGAATAGSGSYSGNYKVELTNDVYLNNTGYNGHGANSTHCIALTDDSSVGWPHSGYAVLDGNSNTSGQFSVIGPTIVIYVDIPGSGYEPASIVFTTTAKDGVIGKKGAYDEIQGGESYDAADATFGKPGSC
jgi:hypothetical protein